MPRQCAGPPWHQRQCWQAANFSVRHIFEKHPDRLNLMVETAGHIRAGLEQLDWLYQDLCAKTCTFCPEPCCLSADVWFDLKDLLFLHAAGLALPVQNPKKHSQMPCAFLGPRGCVLARTNRPWICTWYLCATQKHRLTREDPVRLARIQNLTQQVKTLRATLENRFIALALEDKGQ